MSAPDDGGAAFPRTLVSGNPLGDHAARATLGMSLRDYFAAAALTGLCAAFNEPADAAGCAEGLAEDAFKIADTLIEARAFRAAVQAEVEKPTEAEIIAARERLAHLDSEFYLCSLGDRPQSPGVERLEEARKLRAFLAGVKP